jgi:hypothetical protein
MRFCTRCGREVTGSLAFCTRCGHQLRAPGSEPLRVPGSEPLRVPGSEPLRVPGSEPPPAGEPAEPATVTSVPAAEAADPDPASVTPARALPDEIGQGGRSGHRGAPGAGPGPMRRWIMVAAAAVLLAAMAGGGWLIYRGHARHSLAGQVSGQRSTRPAGLATGPGSPPGQAAVSSAPASPAASLPATSPATAAPGGSPPPGGSSAPGSLPAAPGTSPVTLAPRTLAFSSAHRVAAFAARYFTAINHRDFGAYRTLFAPGSRPISTRGEFEAAYRSTTDSRVRLSDLAPQAGGGWAAGLSFVSHQNSGQSHTGTACTAWRITLFLIPAGHHYLIVAPPAGYRSTSRAC